MPTILPKRPTKAMPTLRQPEAISMQLSQNWALLNALYPLGE